MKKIIFSSLIAASLLLTAGFASADATADCLAQANSAKQAATKQATDAYNTARTAAIDARKTALTNANSALKTSKNNAATAKKTALASAAASLNSAKAQAAKDRATAATAARNAYSQAVSTLKLNSQKDPYSITRDLAIYDASANYAKAIYNAAIADVSTKLGISHDYIISLGNAKQAYDAVKESADDVYNNAMDAAVKIRDAAKTAADAQYTSAAGACQAANKPI